MAKADDEQKKKDDGNALPVCYKTDLKTPLAANNLFYALTK